MEHRRNTSRTPRNTNRKRTQHQRNTQEQRNHTKRSLFQRNLNLTLIHLTLSTQGWNISYCCYKFLCYENHIIMCDFNVRPENTFCEMFLQQFQFKNLINEPTYFKNAENSSCIDLILSSRPWSFQNSWANETRLSGFHKITLTVMKRSFQKYKPRITKFRDHRHFKNNAFREDLLSELLNLNI